MPKLCQLITVLALDWLMVVVEAVLEMVAEPAATTIANPRDDYALASSLAWPAAVIPIAV